MTKDTRPPARSGPAVPAAKAASHQADTGRKRRPGRPARDAGDAPAQIRAAALREFARAGFAGASVLDIARAAGVAKPLIHYHYASKDALWEAAVGEAFVAQQSELEQFRAQQSGETGPAALRVVADRLARFATDHPELTRIVVDESSKGGPRADWLRQNYLVPGYRLAQLLINDYRANHPNAEGAPDVSLVIPALLGVMNFPSLEADVIRDAFGVAAHDKDRVASHADVLFRVMQALL